jgi:hypothetical protein
LARRSLKPQLNQIRTWVRQGRTDAWIAHQLDVSVKDISAFKREHDLASADAEGGNGYDPEEPDLRAEDDALVAAALEAEEDEPEGADEPEDGDDADDGDSDDGAGDDGDGDDKPRARRRRGRRGGRGRGSGGAGGRGRGARQALEGTFDHGEEGYGLWLDPSIQDDPVYAEHWAGHRQVTVTVENDRIVISRAGEDPGDGE